MTKKMLKPWPHQHELCEIALPILKELGWVYLATEERTGKSLTAIMIAEETRASRVLILTKSKAVPGWEKTINNYIHLNSYVVSTYQSVHKINHLQFDIVILDEPHAFISGYPKPSETWKKVFNLVYGLPIIYCSATPYAQGTQLIYHQLRLCAWGPFDRYNSFYDWYKVFAERDKEGNFQVKYIGNSMKPPIDYTKIQHDKVIKIIEHGFVTKTRKELDFEYEPEDKLHYIELSNKTKNIYNHILKYKALEFNHRETNRDYLITCDTSMKLRTTLHMIEGGVCKITEIINNKPVEHYLDLPLNDKVDYILKTWGDTKDLVIMYNYKAEEIKLNKYFNHAKILQATSYAEGVDLSMHKHLVIYSQDFSTSRHTQRRARQANKERTEPIIVHFLLVKKATSEQVYKTVSINKQNFVDSVFEREEI